MVPAAIRYLDRSIRRWWTVLELGSGASTPWLASRAAHVVSLEHDSEWHRRTAVRLEARGLENWDLHLVRLRRFAAFVDALEEERYHLVVIDHAEDDACDRVDCVRACARKLRRGGLLTLDDSDRPHCGMVDSLLRGWPRQRFVGLKARPLVASETTVYQRPLSGPAIASA